MNRKTRVLVVLVALACMFSLPSVAGAETLDFTLDNGMRVLYLRDGGNPVVNVDLVVPGTALRQTAETAGLEQMVFDLLPKGNAVADKATMNRLLDRTSASIWASTERDFSSLRMTCVRPFFEQTLGLFAASWRSPLFEAEEIELARQRRFAAIRAKADNPDEILSALLNGVFYAGHPYRHELDGTLETVAAFDATAIRSHHALLTSQAATFLVVVGDFETDDLRAMLNAVFGDLPRNLATTGALPRFTASADQLVSENRALPTHFIMAKFPAPAPQDAAYPALSLATRILAQRLWDAVRTRQGLAYAVQAGLGQSLTNFGFLYLSTVDETAAMRTIFEEIERMKNEPVPEHELTAAKAVYETRYYMGTESPSSQARRLAEGHIYLGDYRKRHDIMDQVKALTALQIQDAARRFLHEMTFAVLGDLEKLNREAFGPAKP